MADRSKLGRTQARYRHDPGFDQGWRRFRDELDARLMARFGPSFEKQDRAEPDPEILADLALQRALMAF
jgi:hypothetical protein